MVQVRSVLERFRAVGLWQDARQPDRALLERFLTRREEGAFEALVRRHGPMVLGVCRRILRNEHDAEDAFQATFLVLVHKAAALPARGPLGNWLYGVAYHTALKARAATLKRRAREAQVMHMSRREPATEDAWQDWQPVLDQELSRLGDKYREAIVLCDIEGKTRREAARQLGIPEGTVSGRLTTARRTLARRLAGRGVTVSAAALATGLPANAAAAGVPAPLVSATVKAAALRVAGETAAGVISAHVAALTQGVLRSMLWTKLKKAAVCVAVLAFVAAGGGVLAERSLVGFQNADREVRSEEEQESAITSPQTELPNPQSAIRNAREPAVRNPQVTGTLQAVDPARNSVTVRVFSRRDGYLEKTFQLAENARLQCDGKEANLRNLKTGSRTTLTLSADQKTVVSINAASPPMPARLKAVDAGQNTMTLSVGARGDKQDRTYPLASDAKIIVDGREARLTDLNEGVTLSVVMDDADRIILVRLQTTRDRKADE